VVTSDPAAGAGKAALRARFLDRRRARPVPERAAAAAAVTKALLRGLGRLPAAFTQLGARVLLPVTPRDGRELAWAVDTGRLAPGRYGLLEPRGPRLGATAVGTADVVVVPALAVARDGIRLGRGGGYYDRALQHARPDAVVVALLFDDEFVDELPAEPHDRPVTAVVTPSGGWQTLPAMG